MKYDYIEIGTSCFDYICGKTPNMIGISVEPVGFYLDMLPDVGGNIKVQAAISDRDGECEIYYIHPDTIRELKLPNYVKGCNSIDKQHPTIKKLLGDRYSEVCTVERVECITWLTFVGRYNVSDVDIVKIDTEGHDYNILTGVYKGCEELQLFPKIINFEYNLLSNKGDMEAIIAKFVKCGYVGERKGKSDFKLEYGQV